MPLGVRVGMKLEAHDRKDPQLVCVATLADVAPESGRFLVHFDGWDSAYDYWADPGSPWVHPVHWAKEHGHTLTPPSGEAPKLRSPKGIVQHELPTFCNT